MGDEGDAGCERQVERWTRAARACFRVWRRLSRPLHATHCRPMLNP